MLDDDTGDLPGNDTWVPVDKSPIKVNVESLREYSTLLSDEVKNDFNVNLKQGVTPMMRVQSTFGGMGEGKLYRGQHAKSLMAAGAMLKDLSMGLVSLSQAAASIYFEYIGGDDLSKAQVDDVYEAFYPTKGQKTVQDAVNEQQPKNGQQGDGTGQNQPIVDPKQLTEPAMPSAMNNWDDSFVVAEGTNGEYVVNANQSDMIDTPESPLRK
ncbi:hypothetical protein Drose_12195 [Dactylosporangium roseum]|uniref:Uncharacterized protein n=1 Tax=Dactylosporangium roseum TaxID=47989 RepID=A0ABY5ZD54_9ACTN|nr:hypothetical protein [Dactylosporangium roseum]UWZ38910.1 hypothetical protein Drose_12195 [Dactylosporangium roseum]